MSNIYQEIWNADQSQNGLEALFSTEEGDTETGFVKVNANLGDDRNPDFRVLTDAVIPPSKSRTYELSRKLFNNYALPEGAIEVDTAQERAERHEFVEAIIDTLPMQVARSYVEAQIQTTISRERWHNTLVEMWFREFEMGGDPALSGFEHIVVGEQEGGKVQGYHFWYKYYLDDGFARLVDDGAAVLPGLSDDRISYLASKGSAGQAAYPESVTIEFKWDAPDYDAMAVRPLYKKIGGFFVGCSVEGLMALGTVRAHLGAKAPKTAIIEGARYELVVYRSPNNLHLRTFYPKFLGATDPVAGDEAPVRSGPDDSGSIIPGGQGDVRILTAMVNPFGEDPGQETVTVINTGPEPIDVSHWRIFDKNGKSSLLDVQNLLPGVPHMMRLDRNGAQLSNKGGSISLQSKAGQVIHQVNYSRSQAQRPNATIIF